MSVLSWVLLRLDVPALGFLEKSLLLLHSLVEFLQFLIREFRVAALFQECLPLTDQLQHTIYRRTLPVDASHP